MLDWDLFEDFGIFFFVLIIFDIEVDFIILFLVLFVIFCFGFWELEFFFLIWVVLFFDLFVLFLFDVGGVLVIIVLLEFFLEVLLVEKFFWEFWVFVEFGIDWLELGVFICVDVLVIGFMGFVFIVLIFVLFVIFFGTEIFLEILVEEFFLVVIWIFLLILLVLDVKELFEVDFVIVDIDLFEGLDVDLLVLVGLIFKILGFIVFFFLVFGFVLLFFEFFVILFVFFEIEDLVGWRYDGVDDFWLIVLVEIKVLLFVGLLGGIGFIFFIVFVEDWVAGFCILIFFLFDLSVSILDLFLVNFFLDFLSFLFFLLILF